MTTQKRLGRLAAGASALALAGVGLLGAAATAAPGEGPPTDPAATGSLTVHKYDGTPGEAGDGTAQDTKDFGNALDGVEFTLSPITLTNPLTTAEGWEEVEDFSVALPTVPAPLGTSVVKSTVNGVAEFENLPMGAYYVEETASGPNLITGPVTPFIVTIPFPNDGDWLYDVHVYPKNVLTTTEPAKTAEAPEGTAQTGDKIDWTISVAVPRVTGGYSEFTITDSVGAGLTFESWGTITVGGADLVAGDYTVSDNVLTLTGEGLVKLNAAFTEDVDEVAVTAGLTTTVAGQGTFTNKATITLNGVPTDTPEAPTNWGGIIVTKISGENAEATLEGAEFELYDGEGDNATLIGEAKTTGPNGELTFTVWVGNGTVVTRDGLFLKETVAPAGHVLPANPWTAVPMIAADATTSVELSISNTKPEAPELPLTGAQGTLLFTVVGLGLIGAGAAAVAVRRSRATH